MSCVQKIQNAYILYAQKDKSLWILQLHSRLDIENDDDFDVFFSKALLILIIDTQSITLYVMEFIISCATTFGKVD